MDESMTEGEDRMQSLEQGQLWLMRIHASIAAVLIGGGAAALEFGLGDRLGLPRGAVIAPVALLLLYLVLISPGRHFRAWRYAMDEEELRLHSGVWTRTETNVPLARIQHIDVSQGPIERPLGICRLIVHTAGTQHSQVVLPGLSRLTAERMRDEIRARIRVEAE
jgi:membrane protein YdbS with pleckstrin-like domain